MSNEPPGTKNRSKRGAFRSCLARRKIKISKAGISGRSAKKAEAGMATKKRWMHVPAEPAKPGIPKYLKSAAKGKAGPFCSSAGAPLIAFPLTKPGKKEGIHQLKLMI